MLSSQESYLHILDFYYHINRIIETYYTLIINMSKQDCYKKIAARSIHEYQYVEISYVEMNIINIMNIIKIYKYDRNKLNN